MNKGRLYLIPTLLSEEVEAGEVLPAGTLKILPLIDHYIVEEIRTARRFLRKAGVTRSLDEISFEIFNEHSQRDGIEKMLLPAINGKEIGLLSEAGPPCIADPGSEIVAMAHHLGIEVVPLTGPSSILLALMASGFNGQNFSFVGYLPIDRRDRINRIKELERNSKDRDQTQIFIETPYRNLQLFEALLEVCHEETKICLATNVTGADGFILSKSVRAWRSLTPNIKKRPTVFLLYA